MKSIAKAVFGAALSLCLTACAALSLPLGASALDQKQVVVSLGNDGNKNYQLLADALKQASADYMLTVTVASPGTYPVSSTGRAVMLRSNTVLDLNGATLVRSGTMFNFFQNEDLKGNRMNGGYSQTVNSTIQNGTLDGSGGSSDEVNLVNLGHASGLTIKGVSFKNCRGGHLLELTACRSVTVSGCSFTGYYGAVTGDNEAIQLDICDNTVAGKWNGVYYSDSSPCRDITIDSCRFLDYPAGVGNHHTIAGNHNSNIKITNNTFENSLDTDEAAIWCYGFEDSVVSGNTVKGNYGRGIMVSAGSVTIKNNTVKNAGMNALYITRANSYTAGAYCVNTEESARGCSVTGNSLSSDGTAVCLYAGCGVSSVSNNTVTSKNGAGIVASGASIKSISNNKVKSRDNAVQLGTYSSAEKIAFNFLHSSDGAGISVYTADVGKLLCNTVKNCGGQGIYVCDAGTVDRLERNAVSGSAKQGLRMDNSGGKVTLVQNSIEGNGAKNRILPKTSKGKAESDKFAAPIMKSAEGSGDGLKVSWHAFEGAKKYRVFRKAWGASTWKRVGDSSSPSISVKGIEYGERYTYTVRCISEDGKKYESDYDPEGITAVLTEIPGIISSESLYGGLKLRWNTVKGAAGYRVVFRNGSGKWERIGVSDSDSFVDVSIPSNTGRTYTVRPFTENGAYCSGYDTAGFRAFYIESPSINSIQATESGLKLSWGKVRGADHYRVFFKTEGGKWQRLGDASGTSLVDKQIRRGEVRIYTVRCLDSSGKYISAYKPDGWEGRIADIPYIISAYCDDDGITLNWNASEGAARYRVFRRDSKGNWIRSGTVSETVMTDHDVEVGKIYTYTVRCVSPDGSYYISAYDTTGTALKYDVIPKITSGESTGFGIRLSWEEVKGAHTYRVFRKNYMGGWQRVGDTRNLSLTDYSVRNGETCTYTVRCVDKNGKYCSGYDKNGFTHTFRKPRSEHKQLP